MKPKPIHCSRKHLLEFFEYRDGWLFRKKDRASFKAGSRAGGLQAHGYVTVWFDGYRYPAHRLIYFMLKGKQPQTIDHVNQDRLDNRIENLRPATASQQRGNSKTRSDNKLGVRGVYKCGRWGYGARCAGKYLGVFKTLEEASNAYKRYAKKYFGKFAVK